MNKLVNFSIVLLSCLLISGCATNYVKVTKTGASGYYIPFATASVSGYIVEVEGEPLGVNIEYRDGDAIIIYKAPKEKANATKEREE